VCVAFTETTTVDENDNKNLSGDEIAHVNEASAYAH